MGGEHDQWRRRIERLSSSRGWLEAWRVLPTLRRGRMLRRPARHYAIGLGVSVLAVGGVLLLFPLLREQSSSSCGALSALERRRAVPAPWQGPAPAPFPAMDLRLPSVVRCAAAYWRRL